ncbi:hypothetical protein QTP70_026836, partial [Hemibagrus guttatus]
SGKMGKRKDLSEFDKGQIVMARRLDQSISKTAALVGFSRSAVGHGRPRLIDKRGVLTWPPNSSDLNPIEHLWDVLDKQVQSVEAPPRYLQDLKDLLLRFWCQIPQHTFGDLVESMPRQVGCFGSKRGTNTILGR